MLTCSHLLTLRQTDQTPWKYHHQWWFHFRGLRSKFEIAIAPPRPPWRQRGAKPRNFLENSNNTDPSIKLARDSLNISQNKHITCVSTGEFPHFNIKLCCIRQNPAVKWPSTRTSLLINRHLSYCVLSFTLLSQLTRSATTVAFTYWAVYQSQHWVLNILINNKYILILTLILLRTPLFSKFWMRRSRSSVSSSVADILNSGHVIDSRPAFGAHVRNHDAFYRRVCSTCVLAYFIRLV